jgi:D-alanyl-D-alanine carboxypeptidase
MDTKKKKEAERRLKPGMVLSAVFFLAFLFACSAPQEGTAFTASKTPESASATITPAPTVTATAKPSPAVSATKEMTADYIDTAVCTAEEYMNIRDRAGMDGRIIGRLPAGATAGVWEYEDGWARISYEGIEGYASREYLVGLRYPSAFVPDGDWTKILVNQTVLLPGDFSVELADFEGGQVDRRILAVCEEMFADAKEDGVVLTLVDAYRSRSLQSELYEKKVLSYVQQGYGREEAEVKAATITARPDTSEHQTGLALDIVTPAYTSRDRGFAGTKAFEWLRVNAGNYGFVMRYPEDKTDSTGVIYEPWHWRFVGIKAAAEIKEGGESLEEYSDRLNN